MSELSFPKSGYHKHYKTTNNHSIFEFVEKDKMYSVTIPTVVGKETRYAIKDIINNWLFENSLLTSTTEFLTIDDAPYGWMGVAQKSDGLEYVGTFMKRITAYYWKKHGIKLAPEVISKAGNLVGKDTSGETFHFRFDPIANYERGIFGDDDSCFWGDRQMARVLIRNEGGSFIQFFDSPNAILHEDWVENGKGLGRAWILPIDQWYEDGAILFGLFNVYMQHRSINKYNVTRAVSSVLGMTYKYHNNISSPLDVLYVNGGCGMVLGSDPELVARACKDSIQLNYSSNYNNMGAHDPELDSGEDERNYCENCGNYIDDDDFVSELDMCLNCAEQEHFCCTYCGSWFHLDDHVDYNGHSMCAYCADRRGIHWCESCEEYQKDVEYYDIADMNMCRDCYEQEYAECEGCGNTIKKEDAYPAEDGGWWCEDCMNENGGKDMYFACTKCGELRHITDLNEDMKEHSVCNNCASLLIHCPSCSKIAYRSDWAKYDWDAYHGQTVKYICPHCGQERFE